MSFGSDAQSYAGQGAAAGSVLGPEGTVIGAGIGLGAAGIKYLLGANQRKAANAIHPFNPGYQMNNEVIDNARVLGDEYTNYQLPGYSQMLDNLKGSYNNTIENSEKGATSSADVLDAANKANFQQQQQLEALGAQQQQGKKNALTAYLAAKAQAGAEYQDKNTYDREQYNQQLQLKNQLNNNATANQYGAADQAGKLVSSIFSYKGVPTTPGPQGPVQQGLSIFNGSNAGTITPNGNLNAEPVNYYGS